MKFSKQRLEAFSDGVIAIIITIMVLSIPAPKTFELNSILELLRTIAIYFISFIVVGSFWNQHNYIFSYIEEIETKVIWINLLFLFFLSLIPFLTKMVMDNPGNILPAIGYDIIYLIVNLIYMFIFSFVIHNSKNEEIEKLREARKEFNKEMPQRFSWIILITTSFIVLVIVIISTYFKTIATVFLLGVPVISSVSNLFFNKFEKNDKAYSKINSRK